MVQILWLGVGLLAAGLFLLCANSFGPRREQETISVGLIVAAIIYVGFAVVWGNRTWIGVEVIGVAIYGLFYWLSWRQSIYWLAAGWAAHTLWDFVLHFIGAGHTVAPEWYVYACISFDLLVAAYIVYRAPVWNQTKNFQKLSA